MNIPKSFFEFLLQSPGVYKVMWCDWLALYEEKQLRDPNFVSNLKYGHVPENVVLDCYNKGASVLSDGGFFGKKKPITHRAERRVVEEIIAYLNAKAGTNYRASTPATSDLINARMSEGFALDDFKRVIDNKCAGWLNTDRAIYLRPVTLFSKQKFESYLNEKPVNNEQRVNTQSGLRTVGNTIGEALAKLAEQGGTDQGGE